MAVLISVVKTTRIHLFAAKERLQFLVWKIGNRFTTRVILYSLYILLFLSNSHSHKQSHHDSLHFSHNYEKFMFFFSVFCFAKPKIITGICISHYKILKDPVFMDFSGFVLEAFILSAGVSATMVGL